jgi:hypothetical protein
LPNGKAFVVGGDDECKGGSLANAELFEPTSKSFSAKQGTMSTSRTEHTATLLPDGTVLIAGGTVIPSFAGSLATAEVYDPATDLFSSTSNMLIPRSRHTATLLLNGKVLMAGGGDSNAQECELYDPATRAFSTTGRMVLARSGHVAILLNDGRVLIAGGTSDTRAEIYDPTTGTFSLTGSMTTVRLSGHMAIKLMNGKVLLAGGVFAPGPASGGPIQNVTSSAEIFDPATGAFTPTGSMSAPRSGGTAVLLTNGMVWIIEGEYPELYTPSQGTFTPSLNHVFKVQDAGPFRSATVPADGNVLVTGGGSLLIPFAELLDSSSLP